MSFCLFFLLESCLNFFISLECPLGFIESECTLKCTFPYYGQGCGMICECPEDLCDFMFGCIVTGKPGRLQHSMHVINPINIKNVKVCKRY